MSQMKIENDSHWHAIRRQHVGASESAALFGMLPWLTKWQLWMIKAGKLPAPDLDQTKHIKQGKYFEPAIAAWAEDKFNITLRKVHRYLIDDHVRGMGASLDYEQFGTGELTPTEIKWVVRGDGWAYEGDVITETPEYYLMQVQHQMACADAQTAQHLVFIDGDVRRAIYTRREPIVSAIREEVRKFWESVNNGVEPPIDFDADADVYLKYAASLPVAAIDETEEMKALALKYMETAAVIKDCDKELSEIKTMLTHAMVEAAVKKGVTDPTIKVTCNVGTAKLTNTLVAGNEGKIVTPDMVGTRINARAGYRRLTVAPIDETKKGKTDGKDKD